MYFLRIGLLFIINNLLLQEFTDESTKFFLLLFIATLFLESQIIIGFNHIQECGAHIELLRQNIIFQEIFSFFKLPVLMIPVSKKRVKLTWCTREEGLENLESLITQLTELIIIMVINIVP
jgi:hypothetical protein